MRSALVAASLVLAVALVSTARAETSDVSFDDTFDGCTTTTGLGQHWRTFGSWSCKADHARGESTRGFAIVDTQVLGDIDESVRIQLNNRANGSGLVARWEDATHYYAARLFIPATGSPFVDVVRAEGPAIIRLGIAEVRAQREISEVMRFTVEGTASDVHLTVRFGSEVTIAITDSSSRRQQGRAGLLSGGTGVMGESGYLGRTQYDDYHLRAKTPPAPAIVFRDDFDACTSTSGLGPRWTTLGTWYCKVGRARGESTPGFALAKTPELSTTDVKALVQLNGQANASGVVARWVDPTHYFAALIFFNATGPSFVDIVRQDGDRLIVLAHADAPIDLDRSFDVRLRVVGTGVVVALDLFLDGKHLLSAEDTSGALPRGRAGLVSGPQGTGGQTEFRARTQFDNFVLSGS